jgi:predicted amidophosphoribosyltransferase
VLPVRSAFVHSGAARRLVHRLKYQGLVAAARPLAAAMAPLLDPLPPAVVPVPRAALRRWRYGIDPGPELAKAMAAAVGVPVLLGLRPGWWHAARAGPAGCRRGLPVFRPGEDVPPGSMLVDDVVTTGTTLVDAARRLGRVGGAVTATAAASGGVPGAGAGGAGIAVPDRSDVGARIRGTLQPGDAAG